MRTTSPVAGETDSVRRGLMWRTVPPRSTMPRSAPVASAICTKLMCEMRGLAPITSKWPVCSKSGIGCRFTVPNTASEAANLLAQS